jgi:predicted ATPase
MIAHAARGDLSNVEAVYQRCLKALVEDLGVDPSEETATLYKNLLAGEGRFGDSGSQSAITSLEILDDLLVLPAQSTPFIGRQDELREAKALLHDNQLISLTGPGGIGKTRLAIQVAQDSTASFAHGCFFIPLAPIRETAHIIQTIAETLNFPIATHEDPLRQLLRFLRNRNLLIILDNFEHLLDGVGIINHILQAASGVKILVTSREKLNLQGETNYILRGLEYPKIPDAVSKDSYEAITLFLQAARRVQPGYSPAPDDLTYIAKICQIVGGMPLAIELAAAWLHILDVSEVAQELERGFDLLESDKRDTPERHRNIRTVFQQSWALLNSTEQDVYTKLSIFRGGFSREAASHVAGASLQDLAGLVNKSFLTHNPESGRYELHELLRQFGQLKLEEQQEGSGSLMDRYAGYYADFMEVNSVLLRGDSQRKVLKEITSEIENVRAAWRYFLSPPQPNMLWKFAAGLWHVYWIRWWNYAGMELFKQAAGHLKATKDDTCKPILGLVLAFQSYFMAWLGIPEEGYELAQTSVNILSPHDLLEPLVFAYDSLAVNAYMLGKMTEERVAIHNMSKIAASLSNRWLSAFVMFAEGMMALIDGEYAKAQEVGEANLALYEEIGDTSGSTMPLIVLGHRALVEGEFDKARRHYERCLAIAEDIGFPYSSQTSTKYLGKVSIATGKFGEAEDYLRRSLSITSEIGFVRDIVNLIYEFARLRVAQGRTREAVEFLALVIEHPESQQTRWLEGRLIDSAMELLDQVKDQLSEDVLNEALDQGRSLKLEELITALLGS